MDTLNTQQQAPSSTHESQHHLAHWRADVASPYQAKPQSRKRYVIAYEDLYAYGFPIFVGLCGLSLLFVAAIYYGWINP